MECVTSRDMKLVQEQDYFKTTSSHCTAASLYFTTQFQKPGRGDANRHTLARLDPGPVYRDTCFICLSGIALGERVLPARLGLMSTLCSCLCCSARLKGTAIKLELTNLLKEC